MNTPRLSIEELEQDTDYTFRAVHRHQRHLAPGMHVSLLVEDVFGADLRSEVAWVRVLHALDDGKYMAAFIVPVRRFPEIGVTDRLLFRLEHVLETNGMVISA
ncbi:hypothetical protein [Deinococcus frigens]|uniref:hypothetical protein n=1 Tax=Deinococcus frigens TaxID=249403 RepID=UPI000497BB11|nr:hypothetical protein [Deinococcus frigens]